MLIPGKFHPKKLYEQVKFKNKRFRFPKGLSGSDGIFFFLDKKLIIVCFGVKFTGDYRNVAIIPILLRDHRQKSRKPNCSSFYRRLTVIPK